MKKRGGGGCSGTLYGGKRRRRTMRGGMFGFGGGVIAPGTLEATAPYTGPVDARGNAVPDPTDPAGGYTGVGGRRRKSSKKSRKGSKKTRKMRGGANQMSMGGVGYGYTGTGAGGLADATQYVKPGNPI
jgi:hypothetical protein